MPTIMDLCFLCIRDYNCVPVNEKIVSQVEYLLPEITIIKLDVPLRICSVCNGALDGFSKFKQFSVKSSRSLEAIIKGAQGPSLYTASPPYVDHNEENLKKPPRDIQTRTDRTSLNRVDLLERINAEPQNQLQNMKLHTDTNVDKTEEIFIKQEPIEETPQDREIFGNILKEECVSDSMIDDTNNQPEHNTEDESAIFNTSEEVWDGSSTDTAEETIEETDGNWNKNIQTDNENKNQDELKKKIQLKTEYQCYVCTELFQNKDLVSRHVEETHLRRKDLSCTVCKRIFINKYDFKKHMDLHNGTTNFSCSICEKSYFCKQSLMKHLKFHKELKESATHKKNKIKDSLTCSICNKKFKNQYVMQRHIRIHSGIEEFQCDVCNKSFTEHYILTRHMKIHSGVKDFQCDVCNKSFREKINLINHTKIHTGTKEFQCEVCSKSFRQKVNLTRHMKLHLGVKYFPYYYARKK